MSDHNQFLRWRQHFLAELEEWFGGRDCSFELGGFAEADGPRIHARSRAKPKLLDICISGPAMAGALGGQTAFWEIAHETVHLLDPKIPPPTTYLEEGIATWYQNFKIRPERFEPRQPWREAEALVQPYMENGYLRKIVRQLRVRPSNPVRICDISGELLVQHAPEIPTDVASLLTRQFPL